MRIHADDRRDLAQLALTVLLFGLVVAPWLHLGVHHGGVTLPHSAQAFADHGAASETGVPLQPEDEPPEHSHALGGAEHLQISFEVEGELQLARPSKAPSRPLPVLHALVARRVPELLQRMPQAP